MKTWRTFGIILLLLIVAGGVWRWGKKDGPRRNSLATLNRLDVALHSGSSVRLVGSVSLPTAIQFRSAPEQTEFVQKALRDEISPEGLTILRRKGQFGSLTNLFPAEARAGRRTLLRLSN